MSCANAICSGVSCCRRLALLLALRRRRVGEHVERGVEQDLRESRRGGVADRAEDAEARRDAHRLVDDRLDDEVGRLLGRQRRHVLVHLGRRDHRRAHERHVDRREVDALVEELGRRARGERVERRLRRHVGREARRVRQHADRRDVDDVAALLLDHLRQEAHDEPQRAEIVELHRALEIVEAVERVDDAAADRAAGVVDEIVARAVLLQHARDQRIARGQVGDVGGVDPRLAAAARRSPAWSRGAFPRRARRGSPWRRPRRA